MQALCAHGCSAACCYHAALSAVSTGAPVAVGQSNGMQAPSTSANAGEAAQPSSDGEVDQVEASFQAAAERLKQQQAEAALPIEDKLNM